MRTRPETEKTRESSRALALGYLDSNQEQLKRFSVDRPNAAMGRIPRISAVLIAISVRVSTGAYGPNLVILQGSRRVSGLVEGHARSNRFAETFQPFPS